MREPLFPARKFYTDQLPTRNRPDELYRLAHVGGMIDSTRDAIYVSGPLNHSGAARFQNLNGSAFQLNAAMMEMVAKQLAESTEYDRSVLPPHIGRRSGWGEFYYNFHWLTLLSGPPPEQVTQLLQQCENGGVNHALINDLTQDAEQRRDEYHKMLTLFVPVWQRMRGEGRLKPISGIVFLPDSNQSLGGSMEVTAADHLGIPSYYPEFSLPAIAGTIYSRARERGLELDPPVRVNPNQEQMIRLVPRLGTVYQAN